jgi:hypothetical protein
MNYFSKAVVLLKNIDGKQFCQSIILISNKFVLEIQTYLDCYDYVDYFSIRSEDYDVNEIDRIIKSYGDDIAIREIAPFGSIHIEIGGMYGDENSLIDISEIRISSLNGDYITISPDPNRTVADQMCLVELLR